MISIPILCFLVTVGLTLVITAWSAQRWACCRWRR